MLQLLTNEQRDHIPIGILNIYRHPTPTRPGNFQQERCSSFTETGRTDECLHHPTLFGLLHPTYLFWSSYSWDRQYGAIAGNCHKT